MGQILKRPVQPLILRRVYFTVGPRPEHEHCIVWPDLFTDLEIRVTELTGKRPRKFTVEDASDRLKGRVIHTQEGFEGLVPKYRKTPGNIEVFYVTFDVVLEK